MEEAKTKRPRARPASASKAAPPPEASPTAPEILDYLDYRLFLKDRMAHLATVDRKFSQRWVARRAGFKSPQLLSMILAGQRNLTREKAADVATALKLTPAETEYFQLLVDLAAADGHEAQTALLRRLQTSFRDGLFAAIPDDGVEIFRDWYYPAIREIVTLAGAEPTPEWIAGRLGITPEAAGEALATLIAKGFLEDAGGGKLRRATPSVRTARNKIYPMLLGAWHLKMLEQAFGALRLPRDRRHFEGLTFALPRKQFPQLKETIQRFFREVDALVEEGKGDREEVCHLHVELFPLTRWT